MKCENCGAEVPAAATEEEINREFEKMAEFARANIMPQMGTAKFCITHLDNNADVWLALQVGVALMKEKPLIMVVHPDTWIPPKVRRIADEIIVGKLTDPEVRDKMSAAIRRLVGDAERKQ